jgi:hypothetical protein
LELSLLFFWSKLEGSSHKVALSSAIRLVHRELSKMEHRSNVKSVSQANIQTEKDGRFAKTAPLASTLI